MKPKEFPEQNAVFNKPKDMTDEECVALPAFSDGKQIVSCWGLNDIEKLCVLFFGEMWVGILGQGQPPYWLSATNPFSDSEGNPIRIKPIIEKYIERKVAQFIQAQDYIFDESRENAEKMLNDFLNFLFNLAPAQKENSEQS